MNHRQALMFTGLDMWIQVSDLVLCIAFLLCTCISHKRYLFLSEPSKSVTTHSYGIDEYEKKYGETFLPGKGQTEKDDEQSVAVRGYESLQSVYQLPNSCQTSPEDRCLPPCSLGVGDLPSRLQTVNTGSLTTSTTGSQTRKSQAPHPTGRQYQQYKLMVRSVSVSLGPQDVDSIVYMKDIPAEYRRSALVVLQYLERIGDIGYRKVDPLIELLKGISRIDLVSEHVQPYKKRYNSTSDKEETAGIHCSVPFTKNMSK